MPLDNTASIKDIITSLQNLEGINAKAELASVIGSPVTDEDTMSTMVNQIQASKNDLAATIGDAEGTESLQDLVNKVVAGVKITSGSTFPTIKNAVVANGNTTTTNSITIDTSLIGFVPKYILAWTSDLSGGTVSVWFNFNFYHRDATNYGNAMAYTTTFRAPYVNGLLNIPVNIGTNNEATWVAISE